MLGHDEHLLAVPEPCVEPPRDVAHQLQMLALVLPHRDLVGAVGEHVGGLQHRIHEQPRAHQLALGGGLVAELVHALQTAELGHAAQQPAQLGVLQHVPLAEQDAAPRVKARGEQQRGQVVQALAQPGRLVGNGRGVQVHDAVQRLAPILPGDVLGDRADVVA